MPKSDEIDQTAPETVLDPQTAIWLYENLDKIKEIVAVLDDGQGVSGSWTAGSGETITVADGIVTGIS